MENTKINGIVLSVKGTKSLILSEDNKYYVAFDRHTDYIGAKISVNKENTLFMPSYLYAVATMSEDDLSGTLDKIKENWFNHNK